MRPELKQTLRSVWPHVADDVIAVDEACDRWLKRRYEMRQRRRERNESGANARLPNASRAAGSGSDGGE